MVLAPVVDLDLSLDNTIDPEDVAATVASADSVNGSRDAFLD